MKKANELGELLDQIDASALLFRDSSVGGASSCGGKCYQGCKATVTPSDLNMPNVQPSSNYRVVDGEKGAKDVYKKDVSPKLSKTYSSK